MKKIPYADLGDFGEDYRINIIGKTVMEQKKVVAFLTDAKPPSKVERYIKKLKERFPGIVVLGRFDGPTAGVVGVRVGPPEIINEGQPT